MGIHLKNENKTDEMAEIMEHLQQYVPSKRTTETFVMSGSEPITLQMDHFQHILFGGDQLTVARARGAQGILSNSHTGSDRLEGLVPVVEDWHAKVTFMKVLLWFTFTVGYALNRVMTLCLATLTTGACVYIPNCYKLKCLFAYCLIIIVVAVDQAIQDEL